MPDGSPLPAVLLGPKFSTTGIDFTGTVPGLFMSPPFILGIIYMLLDLIQDEVDDMLLDRDTPSPDDGTESDC